MPATMGRPKLDIQWFRTLKQLQPSAQIHLSGRASDTKGFRFIAGNPF